MTSPGCYCGWVRNLKVLILVFGALGLLGLVLNFDELRRLFDHQPLEAIILLGGFALPLLVGLMGVVRPPFQTWQAVVALVGFTVHAIRGRVWRTVPEFLHLGFSYKLVMIAIIGGVIVSGLALAKPEQ